MSAIGGRTLTWIELLVLMVHGPTPTLRGTIRSEAGGDRHHGAAGWASYDRTIPVFANHRLRSDTFDPDDVPGVRVWRDGLRLRVEELDGRVATMADDDTAWSFDGDHDAPRTRPRAELAFGGGAVELTERRDASHWVGDDFTRPTGPVQETTFLGRPAWAVELAPPRHKPHPMHLLVDAAARAEAAERQQWFARHVTAAPLHADVPLEVHGPDLDGATFDAIAAALGRDG